MAELPIILVIEAKEDETIEGTPPHEPTAAEAAAQLESLLADVTKHDSMIGWRVTAVRPA